MPHGRIKVTSNKLGNHFFLRQTKCVCVEGRNREKKPESACVLGATAVAHAPCCPHTSGARTRLLLSLSSSPPGRRLRSPWSSREPRLRVSGVRIGCQAVGEGGLSFWRTRVDGRGGRESARARAHDLGGGQALKEKGERSVKKAAAAERVPCAGAVGLARPFSLPPFLFPPRSLPPSLLRHGARAPWT